MFQRNFPKLSHYYLFFFFFLICRCKNSICNSLIPRAMGVLGSQNSGHVASWDMILCCKVMAGAEEGWAVEATTPFSLLSLCFLFCSSRRVYNYMSWIGYLPKAVLLYIQEKDLITQQCFQEPYLGSLVQQKQKCWVHPLFVLRFACWVHYLLSLWFQ